MKRGCLTTKKLDGLYLFVADGFSNCQYEGTWTTSYKTNKIKIPWFILYFVIAIVIAYFLPQYQETYNHINWLGKKGMVLALFLIGTSFSIEDLKTAGFKSFLLGISLWIIISLGTLFFFL